MSGNAAHAGAVIVVDVADQDVGPVRRAGGGDVVAPARGRAIAGGEHPQGREDPLRRDTIKGLRGDALNDLAEQDVAEVRVDVAGPNRPLPGAAADLAQDR